MAPVTATIFYTPQNPVIVTAPWAVVWNTVQTDRLDRALAGIETKLCIVVGIYRYNGGWFHLDVFISIEWIEFHIIGYKIAASFMYCLAQVKVCTAA